LATKYDGFGYGEYKMTVRDRFESIEDFENRILSFQTLYQEIAKPFEWKFTRKDPKNLLNNLDDKQKIAA